MVEKEKKLRDIKSLFLHSNLEVVESNEDKPWGAYYKMSDSSINNFIAYFFDNHSDGELSSEGGISPKILVFEPGNKLSLQYHTRRAETWKVLAGKLIAAMSDNDKEGEWKEYQEGEEISFGPFIRHRAGAPEGGDWAVVAEIWQHVDHENPSDEEDIVRLKDDYGRVH